jgi:hypothetical protein
MGKTNCGSVLVEELARARRRLPEFARTAPNFGTDTWARAGACVRSIFRLKKGLEMVIWEQEKCECQILDPGYGRKPELRFCVLHSAGAMLLPLVQRLVEAHDDASEPFDAALDRVMPQMRQIMDAYKTKQIGALWMIPRA